MSDRPEKKGKLLTLNVITKNLTMALGSALSESLTTQAKLRRPVKWTKHKWTNLSTFSTSRHVDIKLLRGVVWKCVRVCERRWREGKNTDCGHLGLGYIMAQMWLCYFSVCWSPEARDITCMTRSRLYIYRASFWLMALHLSPRPVPPPLPPQPTFQH